MGRGAVSLGSEMAFQESAAPAGFFLYSEFGEPGIHLLRSGFAFAACSLQLKLRDALLWWLVKIRVCSLFLPSALLSRSQFLGSVEQCRGFLTVG